MEEKKTINLNFRGIKLTGVPIVLGIILIIIAILLSPVVGFVIAYFFGWIAKITIGKFLVEAFALFGIAIPLDKIPLVAGLIGWISVFLPHPTPTNNNNNN